MTCIVGIVKKEKVYIGGDSAGVDGYSISYRKDPKVFKRGEFIFGFTSSFRMGQLLMFGKELNIRKQKSNEDTYEYMVKVFTKGVRKLFKRGGYMKEKDGGEEGGIFLVGYNGRLFSIFEDFQVGENIDGFDSVGCGGKLALGSLFTTSKLNLKPKERVKMALNAAEKFSGGVSSPFNIVQNGKI